MKGNVAAGLALLPRALPGAAAGGPLSPPAGFGEVAAVTGTPACLSASCFEQRGAPGENGQLSKPEFKEKTPRWRAAALGAGKPAPESPGCRLAEGEPPPPEPPSCWLSISASSPSGNHGELAEGTAADLAESTQPGFREAASPSSRRRSRFQALSSACTVSSLRFFRFGFHSSNGARGWGTLCCCPHPLRGRVPSPCAPVLLQ